MTRPRKWPRGYYCYTFSYPDGTPYYVGIGRGSRGSLAAGRNPWAQRVRDKIQRDGGEVLVVLEEFLTREEAAAREIVLITQYGRRDLGTGVLVNLTDGGEGSSGAVRTPEQKTHLSRVMTGRVCPQSTKDAIRLANLGNQNAMGYKHTEKTLRELSEKSKENWENLPEETKRSLSEQRSARMLLMSPEDRSEQASNAWKAQNASSEEMQRRSKMRKVFQK